jgi:hypothetical protein
LSRKLFVKNTAPSPKLFAYIRPMEEKDLIKKSYFNLLYQRPPCAVLAQVGHSTWH